MKYEHVLISAENIEQANNILDELLKDKLIFGGPIIQGPAKFWWKGEICEMDYVYILTYAPVSVKEVLIKRAEAASNEEVCMISFMSMESNNALKTLLDETFAE